MELLEAKVLQVTGGLHFIAEVQDSLHSWAFGVSGSGGSVAAVTVLVFLWASSVGFIFCLLMRDISVKGQQSINSLLRQRMMDAIFCFLLLLHLFRVLEALVSQLSTAGGCLRLTGSNTAKDSNWTLKDAAYLLELLKVMICFLFLHQL